MEPKTLSLEDLLKEKESLIAQANMLNGAMQIVNVLINKLTPKETEDQAHERSER